MIANTAQSLSHLKSSNSQHSTFIQERHRTSRLHRELANGLRAVIDRSIISEPVIFSTGKRSLSAGSQALIAYHWFIL